MYDVLDTLVYNCILHNFKECFNLVGRYLNYTAARNPHVFVHFQRTYIILDIFIVIRIYNAIHIYGQIFCHILYRSK